ncbi:CBS domain-containing protein [Bosea psychrotolerans]|uniref:BON domain-containing protein n=1 Tax=Bosea psychrotolerans TaxID=1871628 RepID=A0A2S4MDP5_9HYPH|nr:CBS domain-containing protein [Bosea psychrotolerans]POR52557.1 BON domain-containing protein [Bosea psychrotolerans]
MNAGDIMTLGAATVRPGTAVLTAVQLMLHHGISGLPVIDDDERLVGMVTERDLLRRAEAGTEQERPRWLSFLMEPAARAEDYVRSHGRKVSDVMTHDPESVAPETPLADVVVLMERRGFKRLPVVRDGKVIGIVSRANFLRVLARRLDDAAKVSVDDLVIRRRIFDEIEKQRWISTDSVDVVVNGGKVELNGVVSDERLREALRVVAESVPGVGEVVDRVRVERPLPHWPM